MCLNILLSTTAKPPNLFKLILLENGVETKSMKEKNLLKTIICFHLRSCYTVYVESQICLAGSLAYVMDRQTYQRDSATSLRMDNDDSSRTIISLYPTRACHFHI
jgi:hypothetical protein